MGKHAFQNPHWLSPRPSLPQGEAGQASMQLPLLPASPPPARRLYVLSAWGLMTSCSAGLLFHTSPPLQPLPRARTALSTHLAPAPKLSRARGSKDSSWQTGPEHQPLSPGAEHGSRSPCEAPLPSHGWALGRCNVAQRPGPVCETWKDCGVCREHDLVWTWGLSTHQLACDRS